MSKLIFCDKNQALVNLVKPIFEELNNNNCWGITLETIHGDVFECQRANPNFKICTASNPDFTFEGNLDNVIAKKFPGEIRKAKKFKWTEHLFFLVTVDSNNKTDKQIIQRALAGVLAYRHKNLILTGIGGLNAVEFANLIRAILSGADLSGANLSGADLYLACLGGANLSGADLSGANLHEANLIRANLSGANLSGADLSGANLSGANLSGADLSGADLVWAKIENTTMFDTNSTLVKYRIIDPGNKKCRVSVYIDSNDIYYEQAKFELSLTNECYEYENTLADRIHSLDTEDISQELIDLYNIQVENFNKYGNAVKIMNVEDADDVMINNAKQIK